MKRQDIDQFLAQKQIGLVGASRDAKKFSSTVYQKLKQSGYELHPIHPKAESLDGTSCVPSVNMLPDNVRTLMIIARPEVTAAVLSEVSNSNISRVWAFSGPGNRANVDTQIERMRGSGVSVISGLCPFMFLEPVGSFHAFHRFIVRLFGRYPK